MYRQKCEGTLVQGRLSESPGLGKCPSYLAGQIPARFREVGPAAAPAADDGGELFHDVAGVDRRDEVLGDRHHERHPPVIDGADDDDAGLDAVAMRVCQLAQLVFAEAARRMRHEFAARELRFLDGGRGAACWLRAPSTFSLLISRASRLFSALQVLDGRAPAIRGRSERTQQLIERTTRRLMVLNGVGSGYRFDAPHARRHTALGQRS